MSDMTKINNACKYLMKNKLSAIIVDNEGRSACIASGISQKLFLIYIADIERRFLELYKTKKAEKYMEDHPKEEKK